MITAKELRSHFGTTCECADCKVAKQAADTIDQLTRERDEALRKVAVYEPVVRQFAGFGYGAACITKRDHERAQRAIEEAEENDGK